MLLQESPEDWKVLSVPTILLFSSFYSVERAPRLRGAIESFCGLGESVLSATPARISSMIGPDFPPSPQGGLMARCLPRRARLGSQQPLNSP